VGEQHRSAPAGVKGLLSTGTRPTAVHSCNLSDTLDSVRENAPNSQSTNTITRVKASDDDAVSDISDGFERGDGCESI
jgi:hypothetical protein